MIIILLWICALYGTKRERRDVLVHALLINMIIKLNILPHWLIFFVTKWRYKNDAIHWQVPWRPVSHLDFTQPHSSRRSYKALKGYLLRGFRECIHRFLSSCEVSCHEKVSQASLFHSLSFHKTPTLALAYCDVSSSGNDLLIHRLILPFFIHSHDPLGLLTHAECLPSQSSSYRR